VRNQNIDFRKNRLAHALCKQRLQASSAESATGHHHEVQSLFETDFSRLIKQVDPEQQAP
jgi:hypothetical protein